MNYIYTGNELISESDIRHWKYINKKKINGKWRYYYDDSEFRSAKKEYNDARYLKEETAIKAKQTKSSYEDAKRKAEEDGRVTIGENLKLSLHKKVSDAAATAAAKAGEHFVKTRSKNMTALMGDAIIGTIAKGAAAVGNFFRRIRGS